jgi:hypothetical protein
MKSPPAMPKAEAAHLAACCGDARVIPGYGSGAAMALIAGGAEGRELGVGFERCCGATLPGRGRRFHHLEETEEEGQHA